MFDGMSRRFKPVARRLGAVVNQDRDARYALLLLIFLPLLALTTIQAVTKAWFSGFEEPVFRAFNNLPGFFYYPFLLVTQPGAFGSLPLWLAAAYYSVNRRCAVVVTASASTAWLAARLFKVLVHRGRPGAVLDVVHLFGREFSGYGFPSGHATFVAAVATTLYYQVPPRYRKYLLWTAIIVGFSRLYLGAHFPLDVIGGWALGASIGALISLLAGNSRGRLGANYVKRALAARGYELRSVRFLSLDARGSRPMYVQDKRGRHYFAKLFGSQEHAADWLFKLYRFIRYKNLEAEEPYFNGRRNVEIESLATIWARQCGVRTPKVIDFVRAGRYWLLVQERVEGQPLDKLRRPSPAQLADVWRQVKKLHAIPMAHRDLRAANVLLDARGRAWLIDFGFAETSPRARRLAIDVAELLMSMSLAAGTKATVTAARRVLGRDSLKAALPYLQKAAFSGATRHNLRRHKKRLPALIDEVKRQTGYRGEVETADLVRVNLVKIYGLVALGVLLYIILPQFKQFRAAFASVGRLEPGWAAAALLFSLFSYVAAAIVYLALADVPLKLRQAALVQLAASFMSKVVPAGLGGTGLAVRYLTKSGLDKAAAAAVVVAQSLIGVVMFVLPLGGLLVLSGQTLGQGLRLPVSRGQLLIALLAIISLGGGLFLVRPLRRRLADFLKRSWRQIEELGSSPAQLAVAAGASLAITLSYIACLYAASRAVHAPIGLQQAALVYAAAVIAKSAIPTPGGLGPLEIAMAASLTASGLASGQAIAAVIVYRLATYWLPIPLSVLAYRLARRLQII